MSVNFSINSLYSFWHLPPEAVPGENSAPPPPASFRPTELVECPGCQRRNAPTRVSCLYCGSEIPPPVHLPDRRRGRLLGVNSAGDLQLVLLPPTAAPTARAIRLLRETLPLSATEASNFLATAQVLARPVPLGGVVSTTEATLFQQEFHACGLQIIILDGPRLELATAPPLLISRLQITPTTLRGLVQNYRYRSDEPTASTNWVEMKWSEVGLLVRGHLTRQRVEREVETSTWRRAGGEVIAARELSEDSGVLDIYGRGGGLQNWRIVGNHFDYSCLAHKRLAATDNFDLLVAAWRRNSPAAFYDENFRHLRPLLDVAWKPAEHTTADGLRRPRLGQALQSETTVETSTDEQFTRYSRLLRLLLGVVRLSEAERRDSATPSP